MFICIETQQSCLVEARVTASLVHLKVILTAPHSRWVKHFISIYNYLQVDSCQSTVYCKYNLCALLFVWIVVPVAAAVGALGAPVFCKLVTELGSYGVASAH